MSSLRVVKWGDGLISTTRPGSAPRLKHLLPIREPLEWGPQHVDLVTQQLLRCCYHRWPLAAAPDFGAYCQALLDGELNFWCDPVLRSFLGIAWVLEAIGDRGANLSNAFLILSPGRSEFERFDPERIEQAFEERIPVPGVFGALVALAGT